MIKRNYHNFKTIIRTLKNNNKRRSPKRLSKTGLLQYKLLYLIILYNPSNKIVKRA